MRLFAIAAISVSLLGSFWGYGQWLDASSDSQTGGHAQMVLMRIRIKTNDRELTATLWDNETSRDFASLLPLKLMMNDLFRREKYAHLPRSISEGGKRSRSYKVGEIGYWSPASDVAVFYRHDGKSIPLPGIIIIGKIDSDVEMLNVPESVAVTMEQIK